MREENGRFFHPAPHVEYLGELVVKAGFNPAESRGDHARWTRGGESAEAQFSTAQYRGHFHDFVVDDFLNGLRSSGATVLKNVPVLGLNGIVAIPDGASKPSETYKPYFIEMKTGGDPKFTGNQKQVYPLICAGGHATSFDPRVSQLGLVAGTPFPPMRVLLVVTEGPGKPFGFIDYCKSIGMEVH